MWIRCANGRLLNTDHVREFYVGSDYDVEGEQVYWVHASLGPDGQGSLDYAHVTATGTEEAADAAMDRLHRLLHEGALADVTF